MRRAAAAAATSVWLVACASLGGLSGGEVDAGAEPDAELAPDARGADAGAGTDADADADADGTPKDGSASDATSEPDVSVVRKIVFVTSQSWIGNFGGLAQADDLCKGAAAGKLTGTFRAWLSAGVVDAKDRITGDGPWYLPSPSGAGAVGALVAPNKQQLLQGTLLHAIDVDQDGQPRSTSAWTGSGSTGLRTGVDCDGWTAGTGMKNGTTGVSLAADAKWSNNIGAGCVSLVGLYCFEQ